MINLMYVVLMAMMALNVSPEVLDAFGIMEDSIRRSNKGASRQNQAVYDSFEEMLRLNPQKTRPWYDKAQEVRRISDSMYVFAEMLKQDIAREADGENGKADSLRNKEDLEAASQVMLSPAKGRGEELKRAIDSFCERMARLVEDPARRHVINDNLSTTVPKGVMGKNWQQYMFEAMPAISAVTMLTKLQGDIRQAEGQVLHTLMQSVGEKDVRVNSLEAFVIPNAQTIVRGSRLSARIGIAAIDTTKVPEIFIGGRKQELKKGLYELSCGKTGDFVLSGYLQVADGAGQTIKREFSLPYQVVEPSATVSADMMNVLYAGYDNPMSISVPGVPLSDISATMTSGMLTKTAPGRFTAKPDKPGQTARISVYSSQWGTRQLMAEYDFRIRKLPEPAPFIDITSEKGTTDRFRGGGIQKNSLTAADGIGAAIDDGILDVPFKVLSFETVFFDRSGNAVPMASEGSRFSDRQKETFRKLTRGRRLYISRITAIGPDGIERKLNTSMEVIIR